MFGRTNIRPVKTERALGALNIHYCYFVVIVVVWVFVCMIGHELQTMVISTDNCHCFVQVLVVFWVEGRGVARILTGLTLQTMVDTAQVTVTVVCRTLCGASPWC